MLGPQHLLPGDLVEVDDHGPPETRREHYPRPVARIRMHAVDAKHAVDVDPDRYKLVAHPLAPPEYHHHGYATHHVGRGGVVVPRDEDSLPIYREPPEPVPFGASYQPKVTTIQEVGDG